jgi:DNA-binding NarL/FixJ family response regulator
MILLISHDAHTRAGLRRALEAHGYSVGEAMNSREGERTMRRVKTAVAIADLQMEIVEAGESVIGALAGVDSSCALYLITTGNRASIGEFDHTKLGARGVFLKPVDPAVVIATLEAAGVGDVMSAAPPAR